jgi:hypothetical protein
VSKDPKTYYQLFVFIVFMDYFPQQLHQWFLTHRKLLESVQYLLPQHCLSLEEENISDISDTRTNLWYLDLESYRGSLQAELAPWRRIWIQSVNVAPKCFLTCLKEYDKNIFFTLHWFLKIGAAVPSIPIPGVPQVRNGLINWAYYPYTGMFQSMQKTFWRD